MRPHSIAVLTGTLLIAACGGRGTGNAVIPRAESRVAVAAQCSAPAYRGLDFWIGDWDAVLRTRDRPDAETWTETRGTNHIEAVLGGCGIEESFHAEGSPPWAGKSLSRYVESEKRWRQTWIDDSGGYLTFAGEASPKETILIAEPRVIEGETRQMRMVFSNIGANAFDWRWERTTDGGHTWRSMLVIAYRRHM